MDYTTIKLSISGVGGQNHFVCKKLVNFVLKSHFYLDFILSVEAYMIPKITSYSPAASKSSVNLKHVSGLLLADPDFSKRGQINILLGASVHASIIEGQERRGGPHETIAVSSKLGWIISGNSGIGSSYCLSVLSDNDESDFCFILEGFRKLEEIFDSSSKKLNPDEQACEDYFVKSHSRNSDARYIAKLPFVIADVESLNFSGSFSIAKNMLSKMESRLARDNQFCDSYLEFMRG